jgi:hypothetical protein
MVLDHIENIVLTEFTPLRTYTHSIYHLKEGIYMVYNSMTQIEHDFREKNGSNIPSFTFDGTLTQQQAQAVSLFHWYSINLVNYAKCIGLILFLSENPIQPYMLAGNRKMRQRLKNIQDEYISSVSELKPVLHFRNKAAAHPAYADPYITKEVFDNAATLIESMSIIPIIKNGRYFVGSLTRQSGEDVSSFSQYPWSLTENFELLIERYFKSDIPSSMLPTHHP